MILVDANLRIYAYNSGSRRHLQAKRWLEKVISDSEHVIYLPDSSYFSFISQIAQTSHIA